MKVTFKQIKSEGPFRKFEADVTGQMPGRPQLSAEEMVKLHPGVRGFKLRGTDTKAPR